MIQTIANFSQNFNSDARFRAVVNFIASAMAAAGWVQSADTGQADPAAILAPVAANQERGYQIWKMTDALAATKPVYVRLGYGGGDSGANNFKLNFTVGFSTDGAGIINSVGRYNFAIQMYFNDFFIDSIASGNTNSIGLIFNTSDAATGSYPSMLFGIERGKNADGSENGNNVYIYHYDGYSNITRLIVLTEGGWTYEGFIVSFPYSANTGVANGKVYSYPILPFAGKPLPPGLLFSYGYLQNFRRSEITPIEVYAGIATSFYAIGMYAPSFGQNAGNNSSGQAIGTNLKLMIRW